MTRGSVNELVAHRLDESLEDPLTRPEALREANRCLFCYDAPCTKACPTHIDIPSFIQKIATDNLLGSARVIMDANPVGASCARVCPTEDLCEGACVLGRDESPIRIGDLQRYATDWAKDCDVTLFQAGPSTGKSVAVVGSGPAGLAAARDLRRHGHAVTIFEAKAQLGGLDTYGIVPFRLPAEASLWEAEQVTRMGVDVRTNTAVGVDISVDELFDDFDAVIVACGMGYVPPLNIPGENQDGVWDAIDFIERAKTGDVLPTVGRRVAVIGAGNTAIDAATCSRRLGADEVMICYRRTEREMTAYPFEYDFAKLEGVSFHWRCAPVRVVGEAGRVVGLELVETELRMDESGRVTPVAVQGSEFVVPVDTVIRAIGQERRTALLDSFGIEHRGGVASVQDGMCTNLPNVFVAGDCTFAKGGREAMVVEAAEQGKSAAASAHAFLTSRATGRTAATDLGLDEAGAQGEGGM
ncbi:NAD(P)-dependent oxidoreductase [Alicyclobacillus sp. ALC3]|uniref:NAD(P)-dependent oxidoreductase n=1 Tax=Alicyclobacillus sp. ALC3 TaxID=2796143 RepID=UPI002379A29F|nr:NAD(P)-dependent oxidoreductase [Alicyclobacillus sp. ALC3]WDL96224.1 NAD(P)-dependent oxidoreductase [Alicyclobacillus sp. ALC3]